MTRKRIKEVRKKPIVTAQDDGEEEEPPAKKHKLCRDLLKRQLLPTEVVLLD